LEARRSGYDISIRTIQAFRKVNMLSKKISRRKFIILAGGAAGAAALAGAGLTLAHPGFSGAEELHFDQPTYGEKTAMNGKILVAYASQAGSTAEVAAFIGKVLAEDGRTVEVRRMREVDDVGPYRAVVAGSAIHGQKWLPEGFEFLRRHRQALAGRPFAAFMVCISLGMAQAEKYRAGLAEWMAPVRDLVRPVSEGHFAGALDFSKLPLNFDTLGLRAAVGLGVLPNGDRRDWTAIRAWAENTRARLA
jgi:menaquinone-dependent protoporphyrinogen oxidase